MPMANRKRMMHIVNPPETDRPQESPFSLHVSLHIITPVLSLRNNLKFMDEITPCGNDAEPLYREEPLWGDRGRPVTHHERGTSLPSSQELFLVLWSVVPQWLCGSAGPTVIMSFLQ